MMTTVELTIEIEKEEDMYVASCLEVPIASQGDTIEQAEENVRQAIALWLDTASREEILERLPHLGEPRKVFRTHIEVPYGQTATDVRC